MITVQIARNLHQTLGTRSAAGYLRKRNVPLAVALHWLLGVAAYRRMVEGIS